MKKALVIIVLAVLAALAAWWYTLREERAAVEQVEVIPAPAEAPAPEPIRYPVEEIATPEPETEAQVEEAPAPDPLPALAESDEVVREQAEQLVAPSALEELLVPDFILSRVVSAVDALDTRRVATPARPLKPVPGRFRVLQSGDEAVISPENAERYTPYVDLVVAADTDQLVSLYLRYYPLLQEAYQGLGKPDAYFNDRAVDMIDLLLATPEPVGLIEVVPNDAVWAFADPELEALPVGQKALLRLSSEDRERVKEKLRELRDALAGAEPGLRGDA